MVASRSRMRSSGTCFVSPSLQSRCTFSHWFVKLVTTGRLSEPPMELDSARAHFSGGLVGGEDPLVDELLAERLVAGDLRSSSTVEDVVAAVPGLDEVGAGPQTDEERQRRRGAALSRAPRGRCAPGPRARSAACASRSVKAASSAASAV
jgi:hypothetical protein